MVRTPLIIQVLFYGMPYMYLMILEKLPILTNLKTFYKNGMQMNYIYINVMLANNFNNI